MVAGPIPQRLHATDIILIGYYFLFISRHFYAPVFVQKTKLQVQCMVVETRSHNFGLVWYHNTTRCHIIIHYVCTYISIQNAQEVMAIACAAQMTQAAAHAVQPAAHAVQAAHCALTQCRLRTARSRSAGCAV